MTAGCATGHGGEHETSWSLLSRGFGLTCQNSARARIAGSLTTVDVAADYCWRVIRDAELQPLGHNVKHAFAVGESSEFTWCEPDQGRLVAAWHGADHCGN